MDELLGLVNLLTGDVLFTWLGELFQAEVTKMTIAFMVASELHSRRVKKEFVLLRSSIDHVAEVTEKRFSAFDARLSRVEQEKK